MFLQFFGLFSCYVKDFDLDKIGKVKCLSSDINQVSNNFEKYWEGVTQVDVTSVICMVSHVVLEDFDINFLGIKVKPTHSHC